MTLTIAAHHPLHDTPQGKSADGLPVESVKYTQILQGARRVFLARGFDAASMSEIARESAVSKGTLYVYFDNKIALFRALIDERRRMTAEQLTTFDPQDHDVSEVLYRFAVRLISELTDPAHVALVRMVVGAAEKFPDLGRALFESGPEFGATRLAEWLSVQVDEGVLDIDDPLIAAWHFLGMCNHPAMITAVMAGTPRPESATIDRLARAAVTAFVRAHSPAGAP